MSNTSDKTYKVKYMELVDYVLKRIEDGIYKPGKKLPSIRELSQSFNCSKATVIRAFSELETMHIVFAVPQSGYFIVDNPYKNKISLDIKPTLIDFSSAAPDLELLPYKDFQHCMNQAIDLYKDALFSYSETQGLHILRKLIAKQLMESQIFKAPEDIFITSGSQQALFILAAMSFPNGKSNILIEQPVYSSLIRILELNGIKALGITRNEKGIDLYELERNFCTGNIKFFYTIPRFHNPTGTELTEEQKKEISELAAKYNVYIVEDDYLADLDSTGKYNAIKSYDYSDMVIYIKSFSKTLLPGLRLGYAVLPKLLHSLFIDYKRSIDINSSILSQGALEIYLKSRMYEKHIGNAKKIYTRRMNYLNKIVERSGIEVKQSAKPRGGFFRLLEFNENLDIDRLAHRLSEKGIYIRVLTPYYLSHSVKHNQVRLSICRVNEAMIDAGIEAIYSELKAIGHNNLNKTKDYPDI